MREHAAVRLLFRFVIAAAEAAAGTFVRLRAQQRSQDGAIEEINCSVTPIMDRTGKVIQIIPEDRRITPLTKVQDQLRQTHAELEQRIAERMIELARSTIGWKPSGKSSASNATRSNVRHGCPVWTTK